jgi:hypothetical protein
MVELYLHSPIRLHGTLLSELNTGTILGFFFVYYNLKQKYYCIVFNDDGLFSFSHSIKYNIPSPEYHIWQTQLPDATSLNLRKHEMNSTQINTRVATCGVRNLSRFVQKETI